MALIDTVLTALRPGVFYRPCDVAALCHIDTDDAGKILHMLERGGLIEGEEGGGYRRKRIYKTRQHRLPGV